MKRLELIEKAKSLFPNIILEKTCIIGAQHILPTTLIMFQSLFEKGLQPKNLFLIGKCYSTNPVTFHEMAKSGIYCCPSSVEFDFHQSYDDQYNANISAFLQHVLATIDSDSFERIIIMDDGGQLIHALHQQVANFDKFVALEQTSAGHNSLLNVKLSIPVVNVARSHAKVHYETPLIIHSLKQKITQFIENKNIQPAKALVIGGGVIGDSMKKELSQICQTLTYDLRQEKSDIKFQNFEDHLSEFQVIIGCTGTNTIMENHLKFMNKNTYLISASSSDREFCTQYFRRNLTSTLPCHSTLEYNGIHLANNGFPINFDGDHDSVDNDSFQLTRALLVIAIFQAYSLKNQSGQFCHLDSDAQSTIINSHLARI